MPYTYETNGKIKKFPTREKAERYAMAVKGLRGVANVKGPAKSAAKKVTKKVAPKVEKQDKEE